MQPPASRVCLLTLLANATSLLQDFAASQRHSAGAQIGQRRTLLPQATAPTPVPPTPLHRTSVSPRAPSGALSFQRRVFAGNPNHRRGFPAPGPEKHHEHRFANTPFQKSKERMLGFWGVPKAEIRARIMSISRVLGAEKPATKRPRSYMEGPCGRKLSIMSTVLPNTPSQKSKGQMWRAS